MSQEIVKKTSELFDSPDKWNSFVEMISYRDAIRNQWYGKLKEEAIKHFTVNDIVSGWSFSSWGVWDMSWYLTDHGDRSIRLLLGWWGELSLYVDGSYYDIAQIRNLIQSDKYSVILSGFERIDRIFDGDRIATECRNFSFNDPNDTKFDLERLSWFAGNQTIKFLDQISVKVNRFRKDQKIFELLNELNIESKKALS